MADLELQQSPRVRSTLFPADLDDPDPVTAVKKASVGCQTESVQQVSTSCQTVAEVNS